LCITWVIYQESLGMGDSHLARVTCPFIFIVYLPSSSFSLF